MHELRWDRNGCNGCGEGLGNRTLLNYTAGRRTATTEQWNRNVHRVCTLTGHAKD